MRKEAVVTARIGKSIESTLLLEVIRTHEEALASLDDLAGGLSQEQANWKPAPDVWSVAECVDHLNQTLGTYIERMEPATREARRERRLGSEPYGRGTIVGRLLVSFLAKPGKKTRTPGVFEPIGGSLDLDDVVRNFRQRSAMLIELAKEADGLALGRIRIGSPASSLLRLSLAQAFEVQNLHTPRHLVQADRLKHHEHFPVG